MREMVRMKSFTSQQAAVTAINAGELEAGDHFLIGTREYRMIDDVWMTEVLGSEELAVDQFDTGDRTEVRGQFDAGIATWSWGKADGVFWAEVIEYIEDDCAEYDTERFEAKSMKSLLHAVAGETASVWTSAVITHDNGKSRSVKL